VRNLLTAFPPLIAHYIFHCIFNISTVKPHEFVKFVSVRLFFALYVVDPHQDFYMRIAMRISAYADHPHEPHGSATAWPTLVQSGLSVTTRVGHADASADAHRMRINAHRCASSAYWAKNEIPFFTYKLPFWL